MPLSDSALSPALQQTIDTIARSTGATANPNVKRRADAFATPNLEMPLAYLRVPAPVILQDNRMPSWLTWAAGAAVVAFLLKGARG